MMMKPNWLWVRLIALFSRERNEWEMDAELPFHLEMQIEENIRRGMSPREARCAALRSFGGVDQIKEDWRWHSGEGIYWLHFLLPACQCSIPLPLTIGCWRSISACRC
jgi:hypothetical protein